MGLLTQSASINSDSHETASVSPASGDLVVVNAVATDGATIPEPTISGTLGLSAGWQLVAPNPASDLRKQWMYVGIANGTAGTVKLDFGVGADINAIGLQVLGYTGSYDSDFTETVRVVARKADGALRTSFSIKNQTVSDTGNRLVGLWGVGDDTAVTAGTGWTEEGQVAAGTQLKLFAQTRTGSHFVNDASWVDASHLIVSTLEIRQTTATAFGPIRAPLGANDAAGSMYRIDGTTVNAKTNETAIFSLPANALVLAWVWSERNAGANSPNTPTGFGLTYSSVTSSDYKTIASPVARATLFVAKTGTSAPADDKISVTWALNQNAHRMIVYQFPTGVDLSGTALAAIVQSATAAVDAGTSLAPTLNAFGAADNATILFWAHDIAAAQDPQFVPGDGLQQLVKPQPLANDRHGGAVWADGEVSPSVTLNVTADAGAVAIELQAEAGATNVAVGQAAETDTAQAVAKTKAKSLTLASTVATAFAITATLSVPVGQAVETGTAQPITVVKNAAVGQATETDTALALSATKLAALGLATETDTAQPITAQQGITVGQAVETDTAQAIAATKAPPVGTATETDTATALSATKAPAVGLATETDTAQPVTVQQAQNVAVGQAVETDTAFSIGVQQGNNIPVGQAAETDTARAVTATKSAAVGTATETDTATEVAATKRAAVDSAIEADTAQPVGVTKAVTVTQAVETDTASALTTTKRETVGQASETDTATTVSATKRPSIGLATETDTAFGISVQQGSNIPVGQAVETDTAFALAATKTLAVGSATETDTVGAVTATKVLAVGQATETDTALPITATKALGIGGLTIERIRIYPAVDRERVRAYPAVDREAITIGG